MTKLQMLKAAGQLIVSVGVGAIVGNAVKMTTPANIGTIKKVCIGVGGFVLSSMVSDQATKYTEEKIDGAIESVKNVVKNEEQN